MATASSHIVLPPSMDAKLRQVRRRQRSLRIVNGVLATACVFLAVLLVAMIADWVLTLFNPMIRIGLTTSCLVASLVTLWVFVAVPALRKTKLRDVAGDVDRSIHDLEERWSTVTELSESADPPQILGSPRMIGRVVEEAVSREDLVDPGKIVTADSIKGKTKIAASLLAVMAALFFVDAEQAWVLLRRFLAPASPVSLTEIDATRGSFVVPRGEPVNLPFALRNRGRDSALLMMQSDDGEASEVTLLPEDENHTEFQFQVSKAESDFRYRVRAGDSETEWFTVTLAERPQLNQVHLELTPPEYTRLEATQLEEWPHKLKAVQGTQLRLRFHSTEPLETCELQLSPQRAVPLSALDANGTEFEFETTLQESLELQPRLMSRAGLEGIKLPRCKITVFEDRPPQVKIVTPEQEITVRPDDEIEIDFVARDDFAVVSAELIAYRGDKPDLENAETVILDSPPSDTSNDDPADTDPGNATANPSETQPSEGTTQPPSDNARNAEDSNTTNNSTAKPGEAESGSDTPRKATASSDENSPTPSDSSADANTAADTSERPQTVRIRIPLENVTDPENIRAKVKLDLKRFGLKQGEELKYEIRVTDSRNASSVGTAQNTPSDNQMASQPNGQTGENNRTGDRTERESGDPNSATKNQNSSEEAARRMDQNSSGESRQPSEGNGNNNTSSRGQSSSDSEKSDANSAAESGESQPGSNSDPNGQESDPSQNSSSSSSSSSSSEQSPSSKNPKNQEPNSGGMTGAPRPDDDMERRNLDVPSQTTASSTMRIHIDEWAGSFDGQRREKLQLEINPYLEKLKAALEAAQGHVDPVETALRNGQAWAEPLAAAMNRALREVEQSTQLITELKARTQGTPYAFIGLQLVEIGETHILPARDAIHQAVGENVEDRTPPVQQAALHIHSALARLAELTKEYDDVIRNEKLAEDLERIEKMYQVFIEDSQAMLGNQRPTLNPKNRKYIQFELDEEFLKRYEELHKQWEEILAELAKVLSEDPRLLRRYMAHNRAHSMSLRDQLTVLADRQRFVGLAVKRWDEQMASAKDSDEKEDEKKPATEDSDGSAEQEKSKNTDEKKPQAADPALSAPQKALVEAIRSRYQSDLADAAAGSIALQEDFVTWLPKGTDLETGPLADLKKLADEIGVEGLVLPTMNSAKQREHAEKMVATLQQFDDGMAALSADSDQPQFTVMANNRLAEARKISLLLSGWMEKMQALDTADVAGAAEVEQHRLTNDTLDLSGKLENLEVQLGDVPVEILDLAAEVKQTLQFEVLVDQMSAELSLRDRDIPTAMEHQASANDSLVRCEELFDEMIRRFIEYDDQLPVNPPDLDALQLPTLEELLARLENEPTLADLLGIPGRPMNLQQMRDWLNRSNPGQGMSGNASQQLGLAEQMRREALRANEKKKEEQTASSPNAEESRRWNTLGSQLEDIIRQGRGNIPPKQYREAIEKYFEQISREATSSQTP